MYNNTGKMINAVASASPGYSERSPEVLTNNSGAFGDGGILQAHSNDISAMWLSVRDPRPDSWLQFDLEQPKEISCMVIWNFNQNEAVGAGLREIDIFFSSDGTEWEELITDQSPFILAKASGEACLYPTNLDDGNSSPIWFYGRTARYVKIRAAGGAGRGTWGSYIEGQYRHGLSAVRFFEYRPEAGPGSRRIFTASSPDSAERSDPSVLGSRWGMSGGDDAGALFGCDPHSMWLSKLCPDFYGILIDLEGTYPISEMYIWNYNEPGNTAAGMKNIRIFYGVCAAEMTELKGEGYPYVLSRASGEPGMAAGNLESASGKPVEFGNLRARYIRIVPAGPCGIGTWGTYNGFEQRYGLGRICIFTGEGDCFEPDHHFTSLLSNYNGWSGADGIFMVPADGVERQMTDEEAKDRRTMLVFSDTFWGEVDPVTRRRKTYQVLNNTSGEFFGNLPQLLKFNVRTGADGKPVPFLANPGHGGYFRWLQDCCVIGGIFYAFTDNIVFNAEGIEGFQFRLTGVDMVRFDLNDEGAEPSAVTTPLFIEEPESYFGCAVLPNTSEAQMPFADGYVYIYGLRGTGLMTKNLLVARCRPSEIEDFSKYTFFDGKNFVTGIANAAPVCSEGGSEMSITPITSGENKGKYLMIYTESGVGSGICSRIGDTLTGPFSEKTLLYEISEPAQTERFGGKKIYSYNAKAHYHISSENSLLVSCNFNTQDFESHLHNAEIYRPRFYRLKQLVKN